MVRVSVAGTAKALVTVRVLVAAISRLAVLLRERLVKVVFALTSILPVVRSAPTTDTALMVLEAPETSNILAALFSVRALVLLMVPTPGRVRVKAPMLTNAPAYARLEITSILELAVWVISPLTVVTTSRSRVPPLRTISAPTVGVPAVILKDPPISMVIMPSRVPPPFQFKI